MRWTAIAKLAGVWIERSEQTTKAGDLNQYSDSELAAVIKASQSDEDDQLGKPPLN